MTKERYLQLFEKYSQGKATTEEVDALLAYEDDFDFRTNTTADNISHQRSKESIYHKLNNSIDNFNKRKKTKQIILLAACFTLVFVFTFILFTKNQNGRLLMAVNKPLVGNDISPARHSTVLTLANGNKIDLNKVKSGSTLLQGNLIIKKQADGLVKIKAISKTYSKKQSVADTNVISTPVGGNYEVTLPDGSRVWLNATSVLKFPSAFSNTQRKVELTGEAYFEVAKNKSAPFKVIFNNSEVEVLGTHFNIMAYPDESFSKTTLLEGSIKIAKNGIKKLLVPSQQAYTNSNQNAIDISSADEEEAMAWRNNTFFFHNENIRLIMRQLAKWYDIDVVYQCNTESKNYGIKMSKSKNISEALKNLELTGTIHFNTSGRRITVMD